MTCSSATARYSPARTGSPRSGTRPDRCCPRRPPSALIGRDHGGQHEHVTSSNPDAGCWASRPGTRALIPEEEPVNTAGAGRQPIYEPMDEPTPAYVWYSMAGVPITDELIEWPPDLFALANVILDRSEAFRFALALKATGGRAALPRGPRRSGKPGCSGALGSRTGVRRSRICCRLSGSPSGSAPTCRSSIWPWVMTGGCWRRC